MRREKILLAIITFLASIQCLIAQTKTLVWSDEFDYNGHPDPQKWNYEEGFVRNKEAQFYTKGRLENAKVTEGNLIITARKEIFKEVSTLRQHDHRR